MAAYMTNQQMGQPDNRKKRPLWIIGGAILLCIIVFLAISAFVLHTQEIAQAIAILTLISIIIGIVLALVNLFVNYVQMHYQKISEPPMPPTVANGSDGGVEPRAMITMPLPIEDTPQAPDPGSDLRVRIHWGEAPRGVRCYGRDAKILEIADDIVARRKNIVGIFGGGGVGKTSVAVSVAELVKNDFAYIHWGSIRNTPPLTTLLQECIQTFSGQQSIQMPPDINEQISLLLKYMHEKRCLLVFDNVESILLAGSHLRQYRAGYEEYGNFFQRISEARHQSCLFLTSREPPREITFPKGDSSAVAVHFLEGLQPDAASLLLRSQKVLGNDEALGRLSQKYAGNPMALILVSAYIHELYMGDVAKFLTLNTTITSEIGNLLHEQFSRLSLLEQNIMYWLAIEREPISLHQLQENFFYASWQQDQRNHFDDAIRSLKKRSLIELNGNLFTLQNVIMEYTTEQFLGHVFDEFMHRR